MLRYVKEEADHHVIRHYVNSPVVYADICALMNLAEDKHLGEHFVKEIRRTYGTVALSWVHFAELSGIPDKKQLAKYGGFLQEIERHICFVNPTAPAVIKQENDGIEPSFLDNEFAKFILLDNKDNLGFLDLQKSLVNFPDTKGRILDIAKEVVPLIETYRASGKRLWKISTDFQGTRATRLVYELALQSLIKQRQWDLSTPNHWADLLHTCVPFSNIDFVLLDSNWVEQCRQFNRWLERRANIRFPTARVYKSHGQHLTKFLDDLGKVRQGSPPPGL